MLRSSASRVIASGIKLDLVASSENQQFKISQYFFNYLGKLKKFKEKFKYLHAINILQNLVFYCNSKSKL